MKMGKMFGLLAGSAMALLAATAADAGTYVAARTVGTTGSVAVSITTDGTIGALVNANITDFNITITDTIGSFNLTPSNASFSTAGGLSATATDLYFDFSGGGYALFQNPFPGSGMNFYCFSGSSLCGKFTNAENLLVGSDYDNVSTNPRSGNVIVASLASSGVPEPMTWAMMIAGFGLVGGSMRYRARKTSVAFA